MLTLADVYQALTNARHEDAARVVIPHVTIDSRQVRAGSLFVALQGERRDGHDFIPDALARGAAVILAEARGGRGLGPNTRLIDCVNSGVAGLQPSPLSLANVHAESLTTLETERRERLRLANVHAESSILGETEGRERLRPCVFIVESSLRALQQLAAFYRRKFKCQAIGITGSVGKSSTKELIAAVLRQRFRTAKSEGNLNNEIGLPLTLLQLDDSVERVVLEMGMYALGEIATLCDIAQPRIGVVTNVGPTHLERLGTLERIAQAKAELVEALPPDGYAILNGDDARVLAMRDKTRARVLCYGLDSRCEVWADAIESFGLEGIAFNLHGGGENLRVRIPLLGRHSVHTALAAASVGLVEGLAWDEIVRGLRDESAQLRLIAVPAESGATILDDTYNASPASSLAALNLLAELDGRKVAVLGDMLELGAEEARGHQVVGARAAQVVDVLIAVGARGQWIGQAARAAGLAAEQVFFATDNARAIEIARAVLRAGDVILVKGSRGMQMEEIVNALARGGIH